MIISGLIKNLYKATKKRKKYYFNLECCLKILLIDFFLNFLFHHKSSLQHHKFPYFSNNKKLKIKERYLDDQDILPKQEHMHENPTTNFLFCCLRSSKNVLKHLNHFD